MNGYSRTLRSASHVVWSTAIGIGITIAFLFCPPVAAYEPIEVMVHPDEVDGARDIEDGNYARGIERLLARLADDPVSHSSRVPLIVDLCAAYTMSEDFESATWYCDQAVEAGWSTGLALNNRGALNVAKGEYEAAIRDFQAAVQARGAGSIARHNLQRIELKVAALSRPNDSSLARVSPPLE